MPAKRKAKSRKTSSRKSSSRVVRSVSSVSVKDNKSSQSDFLALLITILIAALFIFFFVSNMSKSTEVMNNDLTLEKLETRVPLVQQNKSGEFGAAILTEVNGKVKVVIDMNNTPKGVAQPSHIHMGSCAKIGGVTYPLSNVVDGKSETMLNVSMSELRAKLPLAVNVHKSASQSNVYVACGDLLN